MPPRSRSRAAVADDEPSSSGIPVEPPTVPRVATPAGEPTLLNIWNLLRSMQEQILSLQDTVKTHGDTIDNIDGTVDEIHDRVNTIRDKINQAEAAAAKTKTPPSGTAGPSASEQTPRPGLYPAATIHSPLATRPFSRPNFLNPTSGAPKREASPVRAGFGTSYTPPAPPAATAPPAIAPSSAPVAPAPPRPPKMKQPEDFDGVRGRTARQWLVKAILWATIQLPNYNNDERAAVTQLLMLMKPGKAADWAMPQIDKLTRGAPDALTTITAFGDALERAFSDPDAARAAARHLEALHQTGDISDYNSEFENLRMELNWNESALISQYERGLQHRIKQQLALKDPYPPTLAELQAAAVKLGNIFKELDASRPPKANQSQSRDKGKGKERDNSKSSSTSRSQNPNYVDAEERDARRAANLCIKCGAPDHVMRQCRNGYSKVRLSANKPEKTSEEKPKPKEVAKVAQIEEVESEEDSGKE